MSEDAARRSAAEERERRGETSSVEGLRAHQLRDEAGMETPGRTGPPAEGVLVQVCVECGREYTFDEDEPPDDLVCAKCGGRVFRSFFTPTSPDEVEEDYRSSTERDLATDDSPSDVTASDIRDLDHL